MHIYDKIWLNLLALRNVSDKSCGGNQNTRFVLNNVFRKTLPFVR